MALSIHSRSFIRRHRALDWPRFGLAPDLAQAHVRGRASMSNLP